MQTSSLPCRTGGVEKDFKQIPSAFLSFTQTFTTLSCRGLATSQTLQLLSYCGVDTASQHWSSIVTTRIRHNIDPFNREVAPRLCFQIKFTARTFTNPCSFSPPDCSNLSFKIDFQLPTYSWQTSNLRPVVRERLYKTQTIGTIRALRSRGAAVAKSYRADDKANNNLANGEDL